MAEKSTKSCIIVDSSSGIKNGDLKHVYMIPLYIIETINQKETIYKDLIDINTEEIIDSLKNKNSTFKSSQSSIGDMMEILDDLTKKYDTIYVWPISKGLSGSLSTWKMAIEDYPNNDIAVIDSKHINIGIKNIVTHLSKMIEENKTKEEILNYVKNHEDNWFGVLTVNDLTQLKNGGRINSFKAFIATTLKLNILITYDGKLEYLDKEKNIDKAIDKMINKIDSVINFKKHGIKNAYMYTTYNDEQKNKELMEKLSKKIGFEIKEKYYFPAVITLHTGVGTFALFVEANK